MSMDRRKCVGCGCEYAVHLSDKDGCTCGGCIAFDPMREADPTQQETNVLLARIAVALEEQNRALWNLVRVGACGIVKAEDRHAVLMTANDATYHANQALRDQDGDDEEEDAAHGGDADARP